MENILISGVSGFLGEILATKLLEKGDHVYGMMRAESYISPSIINHKNFFKVLIEQDWYLQLEEINFNTVYHLAAAYEEGKGSKDLNEFIYPNILLGLEMLELCKIQNKIMPRFIYAQSYWQFHLGDDRYNPNTLYAATKESFHNLVKYYQKVNGLLALGLVLYETYGPNDKRQKFLNSLAKHIQAGKTVGKFSEYFASHGDQEISISHIDDVANGFILADDLLKTTHEDELLRRYHLRNKTTKSLKTVINDLLISINIDNSFINWGHFEYSKHQVFNLNNGEILPKWIEKKKLENEFYKLVN